MLVERQVLPPSVLAGLGGVFVVGVILVLLHLWGLCTSASVLGSMGWPLTLLGILAIGGAILAKFVMERSNSRQLESSHKQLGMLQLQINQVREERESLDKQLPRGGPIASRLEAAERELAELEELVPLDAKRQAAKQEAEAADSRAQQAETDLAEARRQWKDATAAAGLPKGLSPKQVRELAACVDSIRELQDRMGRSPRRTRPTDQRAGRAHRADRQSRAGNGPRSREAESGRAVARHDRAVGPAGDPHQAASGDSPTGSASPPQAGETRCGDGASPAALAAICSSAPA